ncbi:hypothetical protein D3C73_1312020 [compost metagenome]
MLPAGLPALGCRLTALLGEPEQRLIQFGQLHHIVGDDLADVHEVVLAGGFHDVIERLDMLHGFVGPRVRFFPLPLDPVNHLHNYNRKYHD